MSGSGGSPNSSKKLGLLLLYMSIVAVLFAVIVGIGYLLYETPPADPGTNGNASNHSRPAIYRSYIASEGSMATMVSDGNATRTSLFKSMVLVLATDEGARWLDGNPDWRLFKAQAGYMDGKGLARHWNLVFRSIDSVLIAYVDNGVASIQSIEDYDAGDMPLLENQTLLDSNYLLNNVTRSKEISDGVDDAFSLAFDDDETGGVYRLSYTDPANIDASFTQTYRAKNGEAIENPI